MTVFVISTWIAAEFAGDFRLWSLLFPPTLAVAAIGFIDDHISLSARIRFGVHLIAGTWIVVLGDMNRLSIIGQVLPPPVAAVVAVGIIAWLVNLFNFMDGINGLASFEAVFLALAGALLEWSANNSIGGGFLALLGAAVVGFVPWNFPRAKIFMGDVGSGALGLVFGSFAVLAWMRSESHFLAWLILLASFISDASCTLAIRLMRGLRIFQAHRMHAYQHAADRWGHVPVTISATLVNVLFLFPLASLAARFPERAPMCALVAYFAVLSGIIWLGAGRSKRALAES